VAGLVVGLAVMGGLAGFAGCQRNEALAQRKLAGAQRERADEQRDRAEAQQRLADKRLKYAVGSEARTHAVSERDLFDRNMRSGDAARNGGDVAGARAFYEKGLELGKALLDADPNNP